MNFISRWGWLGLAAYSLSGVMGCVGVPPTSSNSNRGAALEIAELPDVPGCDQVAAAGALQTMAVEGQPDFYLVIGEGGPLCIDDGAGLTALKARTPVNVNSSAIEVPKEEENSDPMPLRDGDYFSSDPMPIRPIDAESRENLSVTE